MPTRPRDCRRGSTLGRWVAITMLLLSAATRIGSAWASEGPIPAETPRNVLILNSYHHGFDWTDRQIEAIVHAFEKAGSTAHLMVEHLDLKRFHRDDQPVAIAHAVWEEYRDRRIDLVIALENPAFNLLSGHRNDMIPGVPVVFAGVNHFGPDMLKGQTAITGVAEALDYAGTIELALTLNPRVRRVLAVHDDTATGRSVRQEMEAFAVSLGGRLEVAYPPPSTYAELSELISQQDQDTIVLLLSFRTDREGRFMGTDAGTALLTRNARVPVYSLRETRLGYGVTGGMLVSAAEHGRRTAGIALRILAGENPDTIPVHTASIATPMFDHRELRRLGLDPGRLPPGSVFVNREVSFYEQHRVYVWAVLVVVTALGGLAAGLMTALIRKNRAEVRLKESENNFSTVINAIGESILLIDRRGKVLSVNEETARRLNTDKEQLVGRCIFDFLPQDLAEQRRRHVEEAFRSGRVVRFEDERRGRTMSHILFPVRSAPDGDVTRLAVQGVDITEQRRAEAAIQESRFFLERIINSIGDPIFVKDEQHRFVLVNDAESRLAGRLSAELIGRTDYDFFPKAQVDVFWRMDDEVLATGRENINEETITDGAGRRRTIITRKARYVDPSGERFIVGVIRDITERRRMEETLRESLLFSRETEKIGRIGGWKVNPAADELLWTDGVRHIIEVPLDYQPGLTEGLKFFAPESVPVIQQALTQVVEDGRPFCVESEVVTATGKRLWVEVRGLLRVVEGEKTSVVGTFQDITARKLAQDEVGESRRMLETLMGNLPGMVYRSRNDSDWTMEFASDGSLALTGYRPDDLVGNRTVSYAELIHPDDRAPVWARIQAAIALKEPFQLVYRIRQASGAERWVWEQGRAVLGVAGEVLALEGFIADITSRKAAEAELRASEQRYRLLVDNAEQGIFVAQRDRLVFANPRVSAISGYSEAELLARDFVEFVHPPDRPQVMERHAAWVAGTTVDPELQFRIVSKTGEIRSVQLTTVRVEWRQAPATLNFLTDITDRIQAESQRQQLEAQLRQAQKMDAIGTLAGGIAHDFNNILGVIFGYVEMLNLTAGDPSTREGLDHIMAAGQRARQLVRQILAFSRQSEQQKLLISLKPVVKETLEFLRASLPATVRLESYLQPDTGAVEADPTQMQQVLMNLCTNAAHAMEGNGGVLRIELVNVSIDASSAASGLPQGEYVMITVSDTGHGIAPGIMSRIFDPYFTTKERSKGTGLGLSVVHGIVQAHGGAIRVQSEPGQGTVFNVYLPRVPEETKSEQRADAPIPRGTERVLFVDDEEGLTDIARQLLTVLGYRPDARTSPYEALAAFQSNPAKYDLVITDMTMPGMTGLALANRMVEIRPDVPIILCTGFSDQLDDRRSLPPAIRALLFKPLVTRELADTIRQVLETSKTAECDAIERR